MSPVPREIIVKRSMSRHEIDLREDLIKKIPKRPNTKKSVQAMQCLETVSIFVIYFTWKARSVTTRRRKIQWWVPGLDESRLMEVKRGLERFIKKVETGEDLNPHLSVLARSSGFVLGPPKDDDISKVREDDKDMILTRLGFHHFHVGVPDAGNPKGRSKYVVFAEVTDDYFTVVSLCDHEAFDRKTQEFEKFYTVCKEYTERNMKQGILYMPNPVTVSGHSSDLTDHAIYCLKTIMKIGGKVDDEAFIRDLFESHGHHLPKKPKLKWQFENLDLCLEAPGNILFPILPFRY
jgi:hypothetical protein